MITGQCECGSIRFQVDGDITDLSHCHCSQCRRLHGAAFATFAGVARRSFRYLAGESLIAAYASSSKNKRLFCSVCGSPVLAETRTEPHTLYLSMGAVDGNPPRPTAYHQFVGSKAAWHEIDDDLQQYDAASPGD